MPTNGDNTPIRWFDNAEMIAGVLDWLSRIRVNDAALNSTA